MASMALALGGLLLLLAPSSLHAFEVRDLSTPESFIADPETGWYYVSNIVGQPTEKDNNGYITQLDADGKVIVKRFADGTKGRPLHAPKGMAVIDQTLYVTDIDHVKGYEKKSGILVMDLDFSPFKASFLNDLTHDGKGHLYVSDMMSNFIAKIDTNDRHAISIVARGEALGQPNGLTIHPKSRRLVMVSWGSGRVVEIDAEGGSSPLIRGEFKNLDGVDFDDQGNLYFSSFTAGKVYRADPDGKVKVFLEGLTTPADINIDPKKQLLLIPSFEGNTAQTVPLK